MRLLELESMSASGDDEVTGREEGSLEGRLDCRCEHRWLCAPKATA